MSPAAWPCHGLWRVIPSPLLTEIFARGGLGLQILDCEHGAYGFDSLLPDLIACERAGGTPFIRVSGHDKVEVQRCLDLGAHGLVFPQLASAAEVAAAAALMDYAPAGTRGFNPFVRAAGYGDPAAAHPPRPWFVPIIETLAAAEQIDAIVAHPRVDLIYIGVYDLSAQLGRPGDLAAPVLAALVDRIIAAAHAAGKPLGMMALTPEAARAWTARGVQVLIHGVDTHRLLQASRAILAPLAPSAPAD